MGVRGTKKHLKCMNKSFVLHQSFVLYHCQYVNQCKTEKVFDINEISLNGLGTSHKTKVVLGNLCVHKMISLYFSQVNDVSTTFVSGSLVRK